MTAAVAAVCDLVIFSMSGFANWRHPREVKCAGGQPGAMGRQRPGSRERRSGSNIPNGRRRAGAESGEPAKPPVKETAGTWRQHPVWGRHDSCGKKKGRQEQRAATVSQNRLASMIGIAGIEGLHGLQACVGCWLPGLQGFMGCMGCIGRRDCRVAGVAGLEGLQGQRRMGTGAGQPIIEALLTTRAWLLDDDENTDVCA